MKVINTDSRLVTEMPTIVEEPELEETVSSEESYCIPPDFNFDNVPRKFKKYLPEQHIYVLVEDMVRGNQN